ncbi:MAG: HD domain-containing protein [Gemmatimonadetes bacterium]|nr:HD domain-containing protein [Gemmatimonadota bacterium]NNL31528.1 HD domain-containing protein [Gemmatimonadota bacterium]
MIRIAHALPAHEHIRTAREAERLGHTREARDAYEQAMRALTPLDAPDLAPKLLRWIAWTHSTDGDHHAALDALEAAEAVATASGDGGALASVLNTRAGTLFGIGELDAAKAMFQRVRALAASQADRKLLAIAEQNLGTVSSIRGDLESALARFKASLAHFEALDEGSYVGPLLNNIGRLQSELGHEAGARATLSRARARCVSEEDVHHLIIVEVNRARLMLRSGEAVRALRTAEEARELSATVGDDRWIGEILLVCGSAHQELENSEVALHFLCRAREIAEGREDPKLIADVVLEQARALRSVGRNRDTLVSLNEARQLFERLEARLDLVSVRERLGELEEAFLTIVRDWGESIESKDAYTQGHCSRVSDYACMLAEVSGMSEHDLRWFRMGALLHDVGKVSVPLEILTKNGRLEDSEWAVMSRHPEFGVELLEGIEFPWDVRPMIRHHHERWDGSGYPDGLAGEDIPLEARILTIADIYDALTTTRSYRPAFSHDKAMAILASERGTTVDAGLLSLFEAEVAPLIAELVLDVAPQAVAV